MDIQDYLKTLSISQLKQAKEIADQLLAEKEEEMKRLVWQVKGRYLYPKNFPQGSYIKAAEYLLELAKENEAENEDWEMCKLVFNFINKFIY